MWGGYFVKSVVRVVVMEARRSRIGGGRVPAWVSGGAFSLSVDWAVELLFWLELSASWWRDEEADWGGRWG